VRRVLYVLEGGTFLERETGNLMVRGDVDDILMLQVAILVTCLLYEEVYNSNMSTRRDDSEGFGVYPYLHY